MEAWEADDDPRTDEELAQAFVDGEVGAFSMIVKRHRQRMLYAARKYARNNEDADDIVQEALFKASRSMDGYRAEAQLGTWLGRLVQTSGFDYNRPRYRSELATLDGGEVPKEADYRLSYRPIEALEHNIMLRQALMALSPKHRTALVLVDLMGHRVDEVAAAENVKVGTIKSRRNRARVQLYEELYPEREASLAE